MTDNVILAHGPLKFTKDKHISSFKMYFTLIIVILLIVFIIAGFSFDKWQQNRWNIRLNEQQRAFQEATDRLAEQRKADKEAADSERKADKEAADSQRKADKEAADIRLAEQQRANLEAIDIRLKEQQRAIQEATDIRLAVLVTENASLKTNLNEISDRMSRIEKLHSATTIRETIKLFENCTMERLAEPILRFEKSSDNPTGGIYQPVSHQEIKDVLGKWKTNFGTSDFKKRYYASRRPPSNSAGNNSDMRNQIYKINQEMNNSQAKRNLPSLQSNNLRFENIFQSLQDYKECVNKIIHFGGRPFELQVCREANAYLSQMTKPDGLTPLVDRFDVIAMGFIIELFPEGIPFPFI